MTFFCADSHRITSKSGLLLTFFTQIPFLCLLMFHFLFISFLVCVYVFILFVFFLHQFNYIFTGRYHEKSDLVLSRTNKLQSRKYVVVLEKSLSIRKKTFISNKPYFYTLNPMFSCFSVLSITLLINYAV